MFEQRRSSSPSSVVYSEVSPSRSFFLEEQNFLPKLRRESSTSQPIQIICYQDVTQKPLHRTASVQFPAQENERRGMSSRLSEISIYSDQFEDNPSCLAEATVPLDPSCRTEVLDVSLNPSCLGIDPTVTLNSSCLNEVAKVPLSISNDISYLLNFHTVCNRKFNLVS